MICEVLLHLIQLRPIVRIVVLSGILKVPLVTLNCAEDFVLMERYWCDVVLVIVEVIKLVVGLVLTYRPASCMVLMIRV